MSRTTGRTTGRTTSRTIALLGVAAVGIVSLAACGSSGDAAGTSSPAGAASSSGSMSSMSAMSMAPSTTGSSSMADMIMIKSFAFTSPASVPAGSTVEVMNRDSEAHTVTADSGGAFNVTIPPGKTVTFTAPTKPGTYAYHCAYHSNMHGSLRVN